MNNMELKNARSSFYAQTSDYYSYLNLPKNQKQINLNFNASQKKKNNN